MRTFLIHLLYYSAFTIFENAVIASGGLKWVRVNVPQYCVPGDMAHLHCEYELGNDTLYAVKWYKEHEEFYRFVKKDRPPAHSYKVDGISVDMSKSNSKKVVLNSVNFKTSGMFRCEVSAEAPSFASAQSEARLEVVSLPKDDPTITGVEMQYQINEDINLNCTSGKSYPASVLHWYINEQQIADPEALIRYPPVTHRHDLVSVTLGLRFKLTSRHFLGGSMRVKCVASVSPVIWRGDRESVVQSLAIQDMREAQLLGEWALLDNIPHVRSSAGKTPMLASSNFLIILIILQHITTAYWGNLTNLLLT